MTALDTLKTFLGRIRWKRFVFFAVFLAVYARSITMLQHNPAIWAEWIVGTLALIPGVLMAFLLFGVVGPVKERD
ncbi:MAG: hypothetical protein P8N09_08810 [Planctomycetota bacterium]|nr:hypothetical protein [Planctomycetota bacterium]